MVPLILPPAQSAVLGNTQFANVWYLFLQALRDYAAAGAGMVRYGTAADRAVLPAVSAPDGGLFVETDTGLIYQARTTAWFCISGTFIVRMTLTVAGPTNINAPTNGAPRLLYLLDQDATGGRLIHWNTGFSYASDDLGAMTASKRSVFAFALDPVTLKYVQVGQPTTDMTA